MALLIYSLAQPLHGRFAFGIAEHTALTAREWIVQVLGPNIAAQCVAPARTRCLQLLTFLLCLALLLCRLGALLATHINEPFLALGASTGRCRSIGIIGRSARFYGLGLRTARWPITEVDIALGISPALDFTSPRDTA